jgi:hypothetical protein
METSFCCDGSQIDSRAGESQYVQVFDPCAAGQHDLGGSSDEGRLESNCKRTCPSSPRDLICSRITWGWFWSIATR